MSQPRSRRKHFLSQKSPRAGETAEGKTDKEQSMPAKPTLHPLETPPVDLRDTLPAHIEAMEEADAGNRLAPAQFAEQQAKAMREELMSIVDPTPPASLDPKGVQSIAGDLLDIRAALVVVGTKLPPLDESPELHGWVNALLNGVDALGVELVEGRSS